MIILSLSKKNKFFAILFLAFFSFLIFLNRISPPVNHYGRTPHPLLDLLFYGCFLAGALFVIFNYYWITVEAGIYKITITKLWGSETVLFYQDYIIEHLEHHDRRGRVYYSVRFKPFESGKTYHIPDKLEHFQELVQFLYKNGKFSGE